MSRFDVLDNLEFEDLCAELLAAATGLAYRAGARGRDQGIDLLAIENGRQHEAQCKHYRRSGSSALKRAAKGEAKKLNERNPELASYRFLCSGRLTHQARKEISENLAPWLKNEEDLLDGSDLERLLELHPEVERRFIKLWFQGVSQLRNMLSAASHARSRALLADIRSSMSQYVETEAFREARGRLEAEGILIVAGAPGVGKTTLAALLVMDSLSASYSPYEIVPGEISAAWELLQDGGERQLFVIDDFLGQVRLESRRSADRDLVRFIGEVRRSGSARLVITSREYILQEARELSEVLDTEIQNEGRLLLRMEDYTRLEKARIFYHHVWLSSELDAGARRALLRRSAYEQIIDHPNYNPRLIEWVTGFSAHTLSAAERRSYVDFCLGILDSPKRLWSIAFESGIGHAGRTLLFALALLSPRVPSRNLEVAFASAAEAAGIDQRTRLFKRTISVLDGSFLTIRPGSDREPVISILNPSLEDFIEGHLRESPADAVAVARGVAYFDQAARFAAMFDERQGDFPATLAAPLAEALERTILPAGCELDWTKLDGRLEVVLSLMRRSPSLQALLLDWLPRPAQEWLERFLPYPNPSQETLCTALELVELGVVARAEMADRLYICAREQQDCLENWLRVRWLAEALPECLEGLRWEHERERFERWLIEALGNPITHFSRSDVNPGGPEPWSLNSFYWDPPETLRDLAAVFEVQVDQFAYEQGYAELLEGFEEEASWVERNPRRLPSRDPITPKPPVLDPLQPEEDGVAALFERLREAD